MVTQKPYSHQLGREAETRAASYLTTKGYKICTRNYRFEKGEIDLIAQQDNILAFIEVKVRTNLRFGYPEHFVTDTQQERYLATASQYIEEINWKGLIRFDIIAMTYQKQKWDITHLKDAFY